MESNALPFRPISREGYREVEEGLAATLLRCARVYATCGVRRACVRMHAAGTRPLLPTPTRVPLSPPNPPHHSIRSVTGSLAAVTTLREQAAPWEGYYKVSAWVCGVCMWVVCACACVGQGVGWGVANAARGGTAPGTLLVWRECHLPTHPPAVPSHPRTYFPPPPH